MDGRTRGERPPAKALAPAISRDRPGCSGRRSAHAWGLMDIFQRSINLNAKKVDDDHLQVTSSLLDLEHSFHLEFTVRISNNVIESVSASMSKAPLRGCSAVVAGLSMLEGLPIERGIIKKMRSLLGGPKGCTHFMELLSDALRFTAMLLLGQASNYWAEIKEGALTEEQILAKGKKLLRNTCLVFADDQAEATPRPATRGNPA
jgi:hypothetical protein